MNRLSVPLEPHSDQGRNFEFKGFQKVGEMMIINKIRTMPLQSPSDSGKIQRDHGKTPVESRGLTSKI